MNHLRDWNELEQRHRSFWRCSDTDRPLIVVTHKHFNNPEHVAAALGEGELSPDAVDPRPLFEEYDCIASAREQIGDDMIAAGQPLLGIPWLEAICGCRVLVPEGKSLWPEPTTETKKAESIYLRKDNLWFNKLLEVIAAVVEHVNNRYAVSMSHLRGPTDILAAMLGTQEFFLALMDNPGRVRRLAMEAAQMYVSVAQAQARLIPAYRSGYVIRQFGLWSPERSNWLQDDTSGMLSLEHYRKFFLEPMRMMAFLPYGVLHLHIPSIHLAETLAPVPKVRTINIYFDDKKTTVSDALPVLRKLQSLKMPLILCKYVEEGFTMEEYKEILDGLSSKGLSVHLKAGSVEEGREVMARVREMTR